MVSNIYAIQKATLNKIERLQKEKQYYTEEWRRQTELFKNEEDERVKNNIDKERKFIEKKFMKTEATLRGLAQKLFLVQEKIKQSEVEKNERRNNIHE